MSPPSTGEVGGGERPSRSVSERWTLSESVPVAAPTPVRRHARRPRIKHEYSNRPRRSLRTPFSGGALRREGQTRLDGDNFGYGEPTQGVIRVFEYHSRTAGAIAMLVRADYSLVKAMLWGRPRKLDRRFIAARACAADRYGVRTGTAVLRQRRWRRRLTQSGPPRRYSCEPGRSR